MFAASTSTWELLGKELLGKELLVDREVNPPAVAKNSNLMEHASK